MFREFSYSLLQFFNLKKMMIYNLLCLSLLPFCCLICWGVQQRTTIKWHYLPINIHGLYSKATTYLNNGLLTLATSAAAAFSSSESGSHLLMHFSNSSSSSCLFRQILPLLLWHPFNWGMYHTYIFTPQTQHARRHIPS